MVGKEETAGNHDFKTFLEKKNMLLTSNIFFSRKVLYIFMYK